MTQDKEILQRLTAIEEAIEGVRNVPFSFEEAAKYLNISKQTLYRMTSQSEIVHYKPAGKKLYFLKPDLDKWITRNRVTPREELARGV